MRIVGGCAITFLKEGNKINRKRTGKSVLTSLIEILITLPTFLEELTREIFASQFHHLGQMIIFDTPSVAWQWMKQRVPREKLENLCTVKLI